MPILEDASTQYGDLTGSAALDWHSGKGDFHDFAAQHCKVDIDRFFPLAFKIHPGMNTAATENFLVITVYAADISVVGKTGPEIDNYGRTHNSKIPAKSFHGKITLKEFAAYAKRFDVILRRTGWSNVNTIEYD